MTGTGSVGFEHYTRYTYMNWSLVVACAFSAVENAVRTFGDFLRRSEPDFVSLVGCNLHGLQLQAVICRLI